MKTEKSHHPLKNLGFLNSFFIPLHYFLKNTWILNISTAQGIDFLFFDLRLRVYPLKIATTVTGVLRYKIWKLE